jgi:hypothetical protein
MSQKPAIIGQTDTDDRFEISKEHVQLMGH